MATQLPSYLATSQFIPDKCSQFIPDKSSQFVPHKCSQSIPDTRSQFIPDKCSQFIRDKCSQFILDKCSQLNPDTCSQFIPDKCSQFIPDKSNKLMQTLMRRYIDGAIFSAPYCCHITWLRASKFNVFAYCTCYAKKASDRAKAHARISEAFPYRDTWLGANGLNVSLQLEKHDTTM